MSDMINVMREHGIKYDGAIIADGNIHRFATGNLHKKNGWYVCYGSAGKFGDWSTGLSVKWRDGSAFSTSYSDVQKNIKREKVKQKASYHTVAEKAETRFKAALCDGFSPYLERKSIQPYGARFDRHTLLVPVCDVVGKIWSLQLIADSGKWFLSGGKVTGGFYALGTIEPKGHVYIAEGYATAASIHMATGATVLVAFNVGNLKPVISALSSYYPYLFITIAADNDQWKTRNIGKETAYQLAGEFGCNVVVPYFTILDGQPTDFNDLHILEGIETVTEQLELHYV